jgi:hypothetical protein
MRRHPLDAEQLDYLKIEAKFFVELPARCFVWCLVGLGHAAGKVPVRLVPRVDQQEPPRPVPEDHIRPDPLASLLGISFGQVGLPGSGVAFVPRSL